MEQPISLVAWILRALLDLLSRNACVQEPILPALVDGRVSGAALRDAILPDYLSGPAQLQRSLAKKDMHPHQFLQLATVKWKELSAERCFSHPSTHRRPWLAYREDLERLVCISSSALDRSSRRRLQRRNAKEYVFCDNIKTVGYEENT